ncbi:MAG: hypothetical protein COV07_01735 [Candidatus Vogelbacteria bacterium CG10_big_fil_rev_8_21_14_0_10_45_14]|uniref:Bacterial spore germination immunoglobulin-like domain-containing protein n=1 Tax=Candidatus Vogelbacteria bacterium CG10_big_fil_rev_8_21_14_0_10_45_14 TaxID=1975042 RepID=A0A2H0RKD5_9BACT|nr:MAG: hypothetical protein COV07_01735 [Candidatus Vogelbacteria bacterium CG10_big_fil_rev_8_21_14_0_10_45_14]
MKSQKAAIFALISLILLALFGYGYALLNRAKEQPENPIVWQEYRSDSFGFLINYPDDWEVYETELDGGGLVHAVNFFPRGSVATTSLPLDHHADSVHVSVFPYGVPTEGVFSTSRPSEVTSILGGFGLDFTLDNDEAWATYLRPSTTPATWDQVGFIFARAPISDLLVYCKRNEIRIEMEGCDPLGSSDMIRRSGKVDERMRRIQVEMIASFQVLPGVETHDPRIKVYSPSRNESIESPLIITGEARGTWYFEATFPIVLTNWDGLIIAEHYAEATDEWMTEDFVPFKATLNFVSPYKNGDPDFMRRGFLILQRSNPSGLPENDAAIEIPVRFSEQN